MYKLGFGLILFMYTIGTASCSKVSSSQSGTSVEESSVILAKAQEVSQITYFHGGWYGMPGAPNWSHDMTFTFSSDGTVGIKAKIPEDDLCGKSGAMTVEERDTFINLINAMKLGSMQFGMIDGGVNLLVIKNKDGEEISIYLPNSDFLGEDQKYAVAGGEAVRDYLVTVFDGLATYCQ